jgi:corrinoid protein of di/trimethylamine methyltransferase
LGKNLQSKEILNKLVEAVIDGDSQSVEKIVQKAISSGVDPVKALKDGLQRGIEIIGESWKQGEAFISQVMTAADAMKAGMVILKPKIIEAQGSDKDIQKLGTVVIGTVFGDVHNIGKDIVSTMLEVAGFEVHDLGVDVPTMKFIEKAEEVKADIIALSCLLSPSLYYQKDVITYLKEMGLTKKIKVIVGGGPVTPDWVKEIRADGYAKFASSAVEVAKLLMKKGKTGKIPIIK